MVIPVLFCRLSATLHRCARSIHPAIILSRLMIVRRRRLCSHVYQPHSRASMCRREGCGMGDDVNDPVFPPEPSRPPKTARSVATQY